MRNGSICLQSPLLLMKIMKFDSFARLSPFAHLPEADSFARLSPFAHLPEAAALSARPRGMLAIKLDRQIFPATPASPDLYNMMAIWKEITAAGTLSIVSSPILKAPP